MTSRTLTAALMVGLAAAVVAGCSPATTDGRSAITAASEPAGPSESGTDRSPGTADPYSAENPRELLDTQLDDADARFLFLAEGQLVGDCMREAGFEYSVAPPTDDPRDANQAHRRHWGEYAFDDVEAARSTGYGVSLDENVNEDASGQVPDNPNAEYVRSLSDQQRVEYQQALNGSEDATFVVTMPEGGEMRGSRDGCVAEARRQLYGSLEEHLEATALQNYLTGVVDMRVEGDPRVERAVADWSQCMNERGYSFGSPMDAYSHVAVPIIEGQEGADRQSEIDVATADAECNRQADLSARVHDVEAEHVESLLNQYQSQLVEIRLMRRQAVERAQELTSVEGA